MSEEVGNGVSIGWGDKMLSTRGISTTVLLCAAGIVASNLYVASLMAREHRRIERRNDVLSCAIMIPTDQREAFARDWHPGAWESRCPWIDEDEKR